jgi:hypothetical protein
MVSEGIPVKLSLEYVMKTLLLSAVFMVSGFSFGQESLDNSSVTILKTALAKTVQAQILNAAITDTHVASALVEIENSFTEKQRAQFGNSFFLERWNLVLSASFQRDNIAKPEDKSKKCLYVVAVLASKIDNTKAIEMLLRSCTNYSGGTDSLTFLNSFDVLNARTAANTNGKSPTKALRFVNPNEIVAADSVLNFVVNEEVKVETVTAASNEETSYKPSEEEAGFYDESEEGI